MKFLEYTPLSRLDAFLSGIDLGDRLLKGSLQAFSCKIAGLDKKLSRSLEQEVVALLTSPDGGSDDTPLGSLYERKSRKTLIDMILTLNHMYPDYDFSTLKPHHFSNEPVATVKLAIENYLMETDKVWTMVLGEDTPLVECIWNAIDEVIQIGDCEVYSYMPDLEGEPFTERGNIWSFNYFFYNHKLRRVIYFSCQCLSKLAMGQVLSSELTEEDTYFPEGMELED